jgi:8-oxo-dGTP pyrophosphatase MutT (NUDIX family)
MGKHDKPVPRSAMAEGPCGMAARNQIGALCWRPHGSGHEVLLITSRDTGRWIIPKGWLVQGLTAAGSAAREAWEEAGIEGKPEEEALGYFAYRKGLDEGRAIPCVVEVFALRVERLTDRYPERGERRRKWFRPEKAAKKVDEPDLRQLILSCAPPVEEGRAKRAAAK